MISLAVVFSLASISLFVYFTIVVVAVAFVCAIVAAIMIIGVCRTGRHTSNQNGAIHSRSYNLRTKGRGGFERSTLLETSDEEF